MTQIYFDCCSDRRALKKRWAAEVGDVTEARDYAARVMQSLIAAPSLEDWRNWALRASDERGNAIFIVPFAAVLGRPN